MMLLLRLHRDAHCFLLCALLCTNKAETMLHSMRLIKILKYWQLKIYLE